VQVRIVLAGDSTDLIKPGVAETLKGKGVPPFIEVLSYAKDNGIRIHV